MRIAIVEDNAAEADSLAAMLSEWSDARGCTIAVSKYVSPLIFLEKCRSDGFDAVFMDIEMPNMNGMDASARLREIDKDVIIVFVTNMAQFALDGYGVSALDFVVKPINRTRLFSLMDKIQSRLAMRVRRTVAIRSANSFIRLDADSIIYLEVYRHRLVYHTLDGDHDVWGSLTDAEKSLPSEKFARCNNGYIVNLAFVKRIDGDDVILDGTDERLKISRPKKKEFLSRLVAYVGGK